MVIEREVGVRFEDSTFGPTLAVDTTPGGGRGGVLRSSGGCVTLEMAARNGVPSMLIWDPEEVGMSPLGDSGAGFVFT